MSLFFLDELRIVRDGKQESEPVDGVSKLIGEVGRKVRATEICYKTNQ